MKVYFISHAPLQRVLAYAIAYMLRRRGHNVVLYEFDFSENVDFVEEISDALVDADAVICLLSQDFMNSNWCIKEFHLAYNAHKLVPILVEDCNRSNLRTVNTFIDLRGMDERDAIAEIESKLDALVEKLMPLAMDYEKTFTIIEKCSIVVPKFAGKLGHAAERWQQRASIFIRNIFQNANVEVILLSDVVENQKQTLQILKDYTADIVLYGTFKEEYVEIGFSSARGWNFQAIDVPRLYPDLKFKVWQERFDDLGRVLKVAFGNLECARNRHEKANDCFTEAISGVAADHAYNMGLQSMYIFRAAWHEELQQWEKVLVDCTEAISLDPRFAIAYIRRAFAHNMLGQHQTAIEDYTEAIRLDPRSAVAYGNRANVFYALGQYKKAIEDCTEAISIYPIFAINYLNRANAHNALGECKEAIEDCTQAIHLNPQLAQAYGHRAFAHNTLGQYWKAIENCTESIRLNPQYDLAYGNRAFAHNALGQYKEAIEDCTKGIRVNPHYSEAYAIRAYTYIMLGQYKEAIEDCTEAIRLNPQLAQAYGSRAFAYNALGQYKEAIEDCTEGIRLNPHKAALHHNRADAHYALGQYQTAIVEYTEAIHLDPRLAKAYKRRADVFLTLQLNCPALKDLQRYIELSKDNNPDLDSQVLALKDLCNDHS